MYDWQSKSKTYPKNHQYNEKEKSLQAAQILQISILSHALLDPQEESISMDALL